MSPGVGRAWGHAQAGRRQPVAPDLPRQHQHPVSRFNRAAFLYFLQRGQQLHSVNVRHRPVANPGEQVTFKLTQGALGMGCAPLRCLLAEPTLPLQCKLLIYQ